MIEFQGIEVENGILIREGSENSRASSMTYPKMWIAKDAIEAGVIMAEVIAKMKAPKP